MSRARIMLLLLVVLCVAVAYAWLATPKQRRITPGQSLPRQTDLRREKVVPAAFPAVADLDFSGDGDSHYRAPRKNLFGPLYLPPKPVKPRHVPLPPKVIKAVEKPPKVVPVVIRPQGPKPIQPLDVLGYLNKAGEYTVFLSSKKGDIFLVKAGDAFADDLVVRSVSVNEMIIGRRQTDQQVVLRLGEVKSQRLLDLRLQSSRPAFEFPQKLNSNKPKPGDDPGVNK
ncbi:MAG: hypothetical protein GQ578_07810 [Desulfuromonadaceae bacterium]|nr:hypothetical protein [Desulfuromonadaceae bacterium]